MKQTFKEFLVEAIETKTYHDIKSWEEEATKRGLTVKDEDTRNQAGRVKTVQGAYDKEGRRKGYLNVVNGSYYGMFEKEVVKESDEGKTWKSFSKDERKKMVHKHTLELSQGKQGTVSAIDLAKHFKKMLHLTDDEDTLRRAIDKLYSEMPELDRYRPRKY